MAFTMAHHSGRYDNMKIEAGFKTYSTKASVVAHTEFGNSDRARKLKQVAAKAGWAFAQHNIKPYDECCFTWNKDTWELVDTAWKELSEITWYSGASGNPMPHFSAFAVCLKHKATGEQWIFATCHTPSHVATWDRFRPMTNRIRCYQDGIKTLGQWVKVLDQKWQQSGTVVTADWNAPCEQRWFRAFLEKNFPRSFHVMSPNAKAPEYPDTHDSRCIDYPVLGGSVAKRGTSRTVRVADSDHKTIYFTLERRKKK